MADALNVSGRPMTPPRAAAAAGILFSALMIASLGIIRLAVPADPTKPGIWFTDPAGRNAIRLALNLVPFAGIAFLWFIGVLRHRVGSSEDQFFATVLLGSGLLFVGSMFASAAAAGALTDTPPGASIRLANDEVYYFARRVTYTFLNVFAIKMAGVFIFSTCTIALRTAIFPRWVAFSGFACGVALLVVISNWLWIALLFPLWILLVSAQILVADKGRHR
jgi:hypothetical protein